MSPSTNLLIDLLSAGANPEYDASLLFCHMILLGIDRQQLDATDPLLLRDMQARCTLCNSKPRCAHELGELGVWPDYCPVGPVLMQLADR